MKKKKKYIIWKTISKSVRDNIFCKIEYVEFGDNYKFLNRAYGHTRSFRFAVCKRIQYIKSFLWWSQYNGTEYRIIEESFNNFSTMLQ